MTGPSVLELLLEELGLTRDLVHDPEQVRRAVQIRANDACEYCLMPTAGRYEIEHVIAEKRYDLYLAGKLPGLGKRDDCCTTANHLLNFAWSCPFCNSSKGARTSRRVRGMTHRLFNPRIDAWREHFYFADDYLFIEPITSIGEATVGILNSNPSYSPR